MIERQIYTALNEGLQFFKDDGARVEEFFVKHQQLTAAEAAKVRAFFELDPDSQNGGPPTVIHAYPRTVGPFPCYAIVLSGDPVQARYLGDDMGDLDYEGDDETDLDGETAQVIGQRLRVSLDLEVYAQDNPDVCIWYYHLLRFIIVSSWEEFTNQGMDNIEISGRDIQPQQRFLPENFWVRQLRFSADVDEMAYEARGKGARLQGSLVEGSAEDDADEVRNIVPYVE